MVRLPLTWVSVIYVLLFGNDGIFFLSSEEVAQRASGNGGNGDDKECIGIEVDTESFGYAKIGSVQITADHMGDTVEVNCPFGSAEFSFGVYYSAVDAQVAHGGAEGEDIVGDISAKTEPHTVEGASLKALSFDPDLISCADIPHVRVEYEEVEQYGERADACDYGAVLRVQGNCVQKQSEYGQCELIHEKLGDMGCVVFKKSKHNRPFRIW